MRQEMLRHYTAAAARELHRAEDTGCSRHQKVNHCGSLENFNVSVSKLDTVQVGINTEHRAREIPKVGKLFQHLAHDESKG
jgi:hypothetical protein